LPLLSKSALVKENALWAIWIAHSTNDKYEKPEREIALYFAKLFKNNKTAIMKKILFVAGALLIPAMATFAQDYTRDYVNTADPIIKSQFTADFPDAKDVHFSRVKYLNEVSFTQVKEEMYAYYDDGAQLVGTIQKESFANLPGNAQKKIQNKYPGYAIDNVVRFDDNESDQTEMILDGTSLDDGDNYFVKLKNDSKTILVKVDLSGGVNYLTTLK
jgi:hypothetical protein